MKNKNLKIRTLASVLTAAMALGNITAYAGAPTAEVDEKLYINMDAYGNIDKANVVKGINFRSASTYTDHGTYTEIVNMSDTQSAQQNGDAVTWNAPADKKTFYFQGSLAPENVTMPWDFDVSYKLNGKKVASDEIAGAAGTVEIDIDAIPNKKASRYMQDNMILMVLIPMDTSSVTAIDAPDSMEASFGNYSGIGFEALPGKEGHFTARFGTDSFESMGVMMIMSPVTVSDLAKVKDLKEIKDKFRTNTNALMDSMEALMDNVSDMSVQLEKTNRILDDLTSGKSKLDHSRTIIFDGVDMTVQDIRNLNAVLTPLDGSVKTAQWMVYDLNQNLNTTNNHLVSAGAVMSKLSKKLRVLADEMETTNTYNIDCLAEDIEEAGIALDDVMADLKKGNTHAKNIVTIAKSDDFDKAISSVGMENADIDDAITEYLPAAVIDAIKLLIPNFNKLSIEELRASQASIASLLDLRNTLNTTFAGMGGYSVTGEDLKGITEGAAVLKASGNDAVLIAAVQRVVANAGIPEPAAAAVVSGLVTGIEGSTGPSPEALKKAENFVNKMAAMIQMKNSLTSLKDNADLGGAGKSIGENIQGISDAATSAVDNAELAYTSVDFENLVALLETTSDDLDDLTDAGAVVSYQTSRLLDSLRKCVSDVDALTTLMNSYYEDVQTALTNVSVTIEQTEKLGEDFANTLQVVNNTLRSASEDFSKAGDTSLSLGRDAVENTGEIIENTKEMKEAGAELRKTINDELDKEEAENNFLNMDPDAVKESLTSNKNPEPKMIQIICRTEEISADKQEAVLEDAEIEAPKTTLLQRVGNIFKNIWSKAAGLFGKA